MRTWNALVLGAVLAGGCIIYEEDLDDGDAPIGERPPGGEVPGGDTAEPEAPRVHLWLDPAGAVPGDVAILSLFGDGQVDLSTITDVEFFGGSGVSVLTTDTRGHDEFLLTVQVPSTAAVGDNDLLVQFEDGTAVYVDVAFEVVAARGDIPEPEGTPPVGDCP